MKNNDLSNRASPTIAIRVEDFLINFKDGSLKDKILNKIKGRFERSEVNEQVMSLINHIFRRTDMTVDLILDMENKKEPYIQFLLDSLPYNRPRFIIKPVELSILLNVGDITYYVDNDAERRSLVNHKYAVTLDEINKVIRGK